MSGKIKQPNNRRPKPNKQRGTPKKRKRKKKRKKRKQTFSVFTVVNSINGTKEGVGGAPLCGQVHNLNVGVGEDLGTGVRSVYSHSLNKCVVCGGWGLGKDGERRVGVRTQVEQGNHKRK